MIPAVSKHITTHALLMTPPPSFQTENSSFRMFFLGGALCRGLVRVGCRHTGNYGVTSCTSLLWCGLRVDGTSRPSGDFALQCSRRGSVAGRENGQQLRILTPTALLLWRAHHGVLPLTALTFDTVHQAARPNKFGGKQA